MFVKYTDSIRQVFRSSVFARVAMFFLILALTITATGHDWDQQAFFSWTKHIREHGLPELYCKSDNDYVPLLHYFLYFFNAFIWNPSDDSQMYRIKFLSIAFGFLTSGVLLQILRRYSLPPERVWLYVFNYAILYNGYIWGQVDEVHTFFTLACALCLHFGETMWAVAFIVLALNMKLQALAFLPFLGLRWLSLTWNRPKLIFGGVLTAVCVQFLILLPFILGNSVGCLAEKVLGTAVGRYPTVSANAFNFWYLVEPQIKPHQPFSDLLPFWFGWTYRQWGLGLFALSMVAATFPVILRYFIRKRQPATLSDWYFDLQSLALAGLLFFYFPTQMHERYSHPAVVFATLAAVFATFARQRAYAVMLLISYAYVTNMEFLIHSLKFSNYLIFPLHYLTTAVIYTVTVGLLFFSVWKSVGRNEKSLTE